MLGALFPEGIQGKAQKACTATIELLLLSGWSAGEPEQVRRGAGGSFAVKDVLKRACNGAPPNWGTLEAQDPLLVDVTTYEPQARALVAMAPGHALFRALQTLGDRLKTPITQVESSWAFLTPIIVQETFTFYFDRERVRRVVALPRRLTLFRSMWRGSENTGESSDEDGDVRVSSNPPPVV